MAEFSWKRGLKHAAIPAVFVIVACIVLVAIIDVKDPEKLGEGAGQFATVCFLIGLGGRSSRSRGGHWVDCPKEQALRAAGVRP